MKIITAFLFLGLAIFALGRRHYQSPTDQEIEEYLKNKYLEDAIEKVEREADDEEEDEVYANLNAEERLHDPRARWTSWRPRISGAIKRNIIIRALKPSCAGCAGICERKVPGRCACTVDRNCWKQRFGK